MGILFMHPLPVLIVSVLAVGMTYFAIDLYRNRRRLSSPSKLENSAFTTLDGLAITPDGHDLQVAEQAAHHAVESAEAAGQFTVRGLSHLIEAIAHAFSHH